MSEDRRSASRAGPGRRRSLRFHDFRPCRWHADESEHDASAWLVDISVHGLALLTENNDSPHPGTVIAPKRRERRAHWQRPAVVRRVQPVSGLLDLVAVEYLDAADQPSNAAISHTKEIST